MIPFRYHVTSLIAVFFALAIGGVVGAGVFKSSDTTADSRGDTRLDPAVVAFENGYADRTSGALLSGVLSGTQVLVVTAPGARAVEVEDLTAKIQEAGGSVTGEVALTGKLLDAANRQFVEGVAQQSAAGVEGLSTDGSSYTRVGSALARALIGRDDLTLDEAAGTIRAAFDEAGLIDLTRAPAGRADLVLVVTGSSSAGNARGSILADLTGQFAAAGRGAALVGPSLTSVDNGVIAQARSSEAADGFATVDVTDTASGRVVAVIALARAAQGDNGSWGSSRSDDGPLPE